MARRSLFDRVAKLTHLPVRLGERIGLFDHVPEGLAPGEKPPRHTFRWDLDKTYLRTEFDSLADLAKNAMQDAADKQAYPGASALLRALSGEDGHRICIVSGSPTQMRQVLAAKLTLDGIDYDEFVLKNNLKNILRGRFRSLRAQIPYKLPAMLQSRCGAAAESETLFGDDAEADAIIYCLYADLLAGRVSLSDLERVLTASRAYDDDASRILALARRHRLRVAEVPVRWADDPRSQVVDLGLLGGTERQAFALADGCGGKRQSRPPSRRSVSLHANRDPGQADPERHCGQHRLVANIYLWRGALGGQPPVPLSLW